MTSNPTSAYPSGLFFVTITHPDRSQLHHPQLFKGCSRSDFQIHQTFIPLFLLYPHSNPVLPHDCSSSLFRLCPTFQSDISWSTRGYFNSLFVPWTFTDRSRSPVMEFIVNANEVVRSRSLRTTRLILTVSLMLLHLPTRGKARLSKQLKKAKIKHPNKVSSAQGVHQRSSPKHTWYFSYWCPPHPFKKIRDIVKICTMFEWSLLWRLYLDDQNIL